MWLPFLALMAASCCAMRGFDSFYVSGLCALMLRCCCAIAESARTSQVGNDGGTGAL
jgi:hypothetical protein